MIVGVNKTASIISNADEKEKLGKTEEVLKNLKENLNNAISEEEEWIIACPTDGEAYDGDDLTRFLKLLELLQSGNFTGLISERQICCK